MDLTGDHIDEFIITGMNQQDEQILVALKFNREKNALAP
jgi:hypothetical protein